MRAISFFIAIASFTLASVQAITAVQAEPATEWAEGHNSKARMFVGAMLLEDGSRELYAGIEIQLMPGWKTYWRHPGEAGGVPPYFNWSKSLNLANTEVFYPAPHRFKDAVGDAIGYKQQVVFPVRLRLEDASRPLDLALNFQYGVCREICIPAEARLALQITPSKVVSMPARLAEALRHVPAPSDARIENQPRIKHIEMRSRTVKPELIIEAQFPLGLSGADVFVVVPGGLYLPMAKPLGQPAGDVLRYRIDISSDVDLKALAGRQLRVTLVSDAMSAEESYTLSSGS